MEVEGGTQDPGQGTGDTQCTVREIKTRKSSLEGADSGNFGNFIPNLPRRLLQKKREFGDFHRLNPRISVIKSRYFRANFAPLSHEIRSALITRQVKKG